MSTKEILYHYCSIESFYGIITSKKIWLSAASQSNDSKELSYLDELLTIARNEFDGNIDIAARSADICECSKWLPFIFCLSEHDDLLSQWRGYGANGTGFSIGFNLCAIEALLKNINNSSSRPLLNFESVIYNCNDQKEIVTKCLRENKLEELIYGFYPRFKNDSFHEEKEWRLISGLSMGGTGFRSFDSIKFRMSNSQMLMHLEIPIEQYFPSLIKEIIIGPKSKIERSTLHFFLRNHGLAGVQIRESKVSLR